MAKKTLVILSCDICGAEASSSAVLNGYEIDLCDSHSQPLEAYAGKGVKVSAARASKGASRTVQSNAATVRAWAEANGFNVPARGRIPASIHEAFDKANA